MGLQERGDLCQPLLYRETVNRQRLRNCTIVGAGPALDLCTKSEELAPIVWPNLSSAVSKAGNYSGPQMIVPTQNTVGK